MSPDDPLRLKAWYLAQRALAVLMLMLASPVLLIAWIATRVTTRHRFLFIQDRVGVHGQIIRVLKIQTMDPTRTAGRELGVRGSDSAITPLGRIMRYLKVDELPQLWNVVRGDMTLVGPRPLPRPLEAELCDKIPGFELRRVVRPGVTSVGQLIVWDNGLGEKLVDDWSARFEAEKHYIAARGIRYDLLVLGLSAAYLLRKLWAGVRRKPRPSPSSVLGVPIDPTDYEATLGQIGTWLERGTPNYVCAVPVHSLMDSFRYPEHREALLAAGANVADGMGIVWALRLLGHRRTQRVYGPTLMERILEAAPTRGWRIGLLGGTADCLAELERRLRDRYPDTRIAFAESPPFRQLGEEEDPSCMARIRSAEIDVLLVGLGSPKQEVWMKQHAANTGAVCIGVGAAFDFHAGRVLQAPRWIQAMTLEWFFRLLCEPRRLLPRYLRANPAFVVRFGIQLLKHRLGLGRANRLGAPA